MDKVLYWARNEDEETAHAVVHEHTHTEGGMDLLTLTAACGRHLVGKRGALSVVPRSDLGDTRCLNCGGTISGGRVKEDGATTIRAEKTTIVTEAVMLSWEGFYCQVTAEGVRFIKADEDVFLDEGDEEHIKRLIGSAFEVHKKLKARS